MGWEQSSSLINNILLFFSIISFGALAGYFCERVGIINIAIDGQMIFGAMMFSIFGMLFNQWFPNTGGMLFIIPLLLSMILSILLSMIYGYLTIKLKTNHIIAGTSINLVIAGLGTFLTVPLGGAISEGKSAKILTSFSPTMQLGEGSGLFGETIIIFIVSLLIIFALWFLIAKSRFGLRFKAIGDNPNAVDSQGINVLKYQWTGIIISGMVAALAGSIFMYGGTKIGSPSNYFEGNVSGLGFLCVAIVVSGGWKIPLITISSIIFAILTCVFQDQNILTSIGLSTQTLTYASYIGKSIPFIFSFITLIIFSRKNTSPRFLGNHFDKSSR